MSEQKQGMARIYRKSWCHDNLFGSSRFEFTPAMRGIWNDLLDMAKLSRVRPGLIAPSEGTAYTDEWLAAFLNCPLETFKEACSVFVQTKRISKNGAGIEILNWKKYQTEYDRQKPYRKGSGGKPINKLCPSCGYKGKTAEDACPECSEPLKIDYKGGKFGHLIQE